MQQQTKWQSFASLAWYDGLIEFLFRFVAKTSEPLLAAGIVYSAADVLSRGHLLANTGVVSNAWSLTQALAIESSGGVVLVYGLTSLKEKDDVKAWLYLALSALLAIAGGIMLFMQLASLEYQSNSPFMLGLFGLRCVVSVGYIYLCRTKHIRFADLAVPSQSAPVSVQLNITRDDLKAVVAEVLTETTLIPERAEALGGTVGTDRGTDSGTEEIPHLLFSQDTSPTQRLEAARAWLIETDQAVTVGTLQLAARVRRQTAVDFLKSNSQESEASRG